jgi:hypothetical protein
MLNRPHSFDDIIGHNIIKKYFIERLQKGNLPQFIILEGPEGLGKTSMAEVIAITVNYGFDDSPEKTKAIKEVIDNRHSIDCIKKYNMAKDSGKDTAKEVLAELSPAMSTTGRKVVICDECHAISESAQDVFLVDTEFIPKNTYLIMCTTDKKKLKSTLLSRAVSIPLSALTTNEMVTVLQNEVSARNLRIQGGVGVLKMIAEWADNKPRKALNILNAFGNNDTVSTDMVREFIGYMDMSEVLPLVTSLAGSMTYGLTYISEMKLSDSLVDVLVEILRVKTGQPSYKMSIEDYHNAKRQLESVPEECIMKFLHKVASLPKLTRAGLISAFTYSHISYERLFKEEKGVLLEEQTQKLANRELAPELSARVHNNAPSMEDLLSGSSIIGEAPKF